MSNQIQNLIATGRTKEAIQILIDSNDSELSNHGTMLMHRYDSNETENRRGLLCAQEYNISKNKIVNAVLFLCTSNSTYQSVAPHQAPTPQRDINETRLLEIIAANKRRRPQIADEAQTILNEYREWSDEKIKKASFDPVNRRLKGIQVKAEALINSLA